MEEGTWKVSGRPGETWEGRTGSTRLRVACMCHVKELARSLPPLHPTERVVRNHKGTGTGDRNRYAPTKNCPDCAHGITPYYCGAPNGVSLI